MTQYLYKRRLLKFLFAMVLIMILTPMRFYASLSEGTADTFGQNRSLNFLCFALSESIGNDPVGVTVEIAEDIFKKANSSEIDYKIMMMCVMTNNHILRLERAKEMGNQILQLTMITPEQKNKVDNCLQLIEDYMKK